jgi:hypothetical protein
MVSWDYTYRIEYHRVLGRDKRALEYVEVVEDAGFCMSRVGMTQQEWLVHYTKVCAVDYLERVNPRPGEWLVIVYRTPKGVARTTVCSIRMRTGDE